MLFICKYIYIYIYIIFLYNIFYIYSLIFILEDNKKNIKIRY